MKMRIKTGPRGSGPLSAIIAGLVITQAALWFSQSLTLSRGLGVHSKRKLVSEAFSSELLEFFRSQTNLSLKNYLKVNPITGSTDFSTLYRLCSEINLVDRSAGILLRPDPLADLPLSFLKGPTVATDANRFYRIKVINAVTMVPRDDLCPLSPAEIYFPNETPPSGTPASQVMTADEKFIVTLGVSWMERGQGERRVILSTLIPN